MPDWTSARGRRTTAESSGDCWMSKKPWVDRWRIPLAWIGFGFGVACAVAGCNATGESASQSESNDRATPTSASRPAGETEMPPAENDAPQTNPQYNPLSADEERVILRKGTERAFIGEYTDLKDLGTYVCRRCNAPLYR